MPVWLGRGVDIRRKTPKPERQRTPLPERGVVDLTRKLPKKRNTYFDPEEVTFAMLAGPHALKRLFHEGQDEIRKIYTEMEDIYSKFLPNSNDSAWEYQIGMLWDCPESPFGLCMYHKFKDPMCDCCVFCQEPNERK